MLRYISLMMLAIAGVVSTHHRPSTKALAAFDDTSCDKKCRSNCIDKGAGDVCIEKCGCLTLQDGIAQLYVDQMLCSSDCKQKKSKACASEVALNHVKCANKCNQVCLHLCDYFSQGQPCKSDCYVTLSSENEDAYDLKDESEDESYKNLFGDSDEMLALTTVQRESVSQIKKIDEISESNTTDSRQTFIDDAQEEQNITSIKIEEISETTDIEESEQVPKVRKRDADLDDMDSGYTSYYLYPADEFNDTDRTSDSLTEELSLAENFQRPDFISDELNDTDYLNATDDVNDTDDLVRYDTSNAIRNPDLPRYGGSAALKALFGSQVEAESATTSPTTYVVAMILAFVFTISLVAILRARKADTLGDYHKADVTSYSESQEAISKIFKEDNEKNLIEQCSKF